MTGGSPYYEMLLGLRAGAKKRLGQAASAPNLTKLDKFTYVESPDFVKLTGMT